MATGDTTHRMTQDRAASSTAGRPITLVCCADAGFTIPLVATLTSVAVNLAASWDLDLYIIGKGFSSAAEARIAQVVTTHHARSTVTWKAPDEQWLGDVPLPLAYFTLATYYRLMIPEVVSETCEKAIYLDSDLIVEADLAALWREPVGEAAVLAAPDVTTRRHPQSDAYGYWQPPEEPGFNSGVLVLNLQRWREEDIATKILAHVRQHASQNRFADQDGTNAVLAAEWAQLDPRWNVQTKGQHTLSESRKHFISVGPPDQWYIHHFIGSHKPWNSLLRRPRQHRFFYYLRRSGWFTPGQYARWYLGARMRGAWKTLRYKAWQMKKRWRTHAVSNDVR